MRYLLILSLLPPLTGCMMFDDAMYCDVPDSCQAAPIAPVRATAEPPAIVPAAATAPAQTREPPR